MGREVYGAGMARVNRVRRMVGERVFEPEVVRTNCFDSVSKVYVPLRKRFFGDLASYG